jgi:uncharacterized membrane protein
MGPRLRPDYVLSAAGCGLGAAALYVGLPGGPMAAFLLPVASAVTCALLRSLLAAPGARASDAGVIAVCDAIMLRLSAFVVSVHAAVIFGLLGLLWGRGWTARMVPIMLGLTLVGIGNLLPRTRPNVAFGIRTARTLSDRACWMRTHRRAGYVLVGAGIAVVLSAVAVPAPVGPRMILAIAPAASIVLVMLTLAGRRSEA